MNASEAMEINTGGTTIHLRRQGTGPALLLLHGFPQTHLMWRSVAPLLASHFTTICPDLRGYGQSGCPSSNADHTPYSKRVMANDMVSIIQHLGFNECMVAGHDRGARVAYRMALDHPQLVKRLAVLDIVPTGEVWNRADKRIIDFWPWSLLSQPAPLPEKLLMAAPETIIDNAFKEWGTDTAVFSEEVRDAYVLALRDPEHIHAICEEFRAAATIDHVHDNEDQQQNKRIHCPVLALWSAGGPVDTWYTTAGGPLGVWRNWAHRVEGNAMAGGHFFPEAAPEATADALRQFFVQT
jgi:haloacetate dehalogenase